MKQKDVVCIQNTMNMDVTTDIHRKFKSQVYCNITQRGVYYIQDVPHWNFNLLAKTALSFTHISTQVQLFRAVRISDIM